MSKPILSGAPFDHYPNRSTVKPRRIDTLRLALWKPWDIVQSHVRFNMDFGGGPSETLGQRSERELFVLKMPLEDVGDAGLGIHNKAHGLKPSGVSLKDEHEATLAEISLRNLMIGLPPLKDVQEALAYLYPTETQPTMQTMGNEFNQYVAPPERQFFTENDLTPWLKRVNEFVHKLRYQLPTKKQYRAHLTAPIDSYDDRRVLQKLGAVRVPKTIYWNA